MQSAVAHLAAPEEARRGDSMLRRLRFTCAVCAIVLLLVPTAVLFGWALRIESLKRVVPNVTAMNPLSAFLFIFTGLTLWILRSRNERSGYEAILARVLAAAVVGAGATKLFSIMSGVAIPIDRLFFTAQLATGGRNYTPNQIAPNTALNFVLLGVALLLLQTKARNAHRAAQCLAVIPAFSGLFALIGYAYGSPTFYAVGTFNPMALHTAALFIFLSVGVLLCRGEEGLTAVVASDSAGGIVARRLLPLAIGLPVALGGLAIWGARAGWYDGEFAAVMHVTLLIVLFSALTWWMARKLFRLDLNRQELERIRHEQDERLRQMAEHIEDVFWMTSTDGHQVLYVSSAYEKVWGRPCDELYTRPWQRMEAIHETDRERVLRSFIEDAPSGRYAEEFRILRPDGTVRWVKDRAFPVRNRAGEVYRLAGIATDITERKESERALRQAQADAERANHSKSEFLSRMSHELRTPLNAILGFGQLLELEELGEDHQESVRHIVSAGHHLLGLINEVLDIARIEAGRMAVSLEPVSVSEVLRDAITLMRPLAGERQIEVIQCDPPESELFVTADRQRLKQVVINLLSNAIKYNRLGGQVRIATKVAARGQGLVTRVSISDTGAGIPAEKTAQLFTPFERLGAENTAVDGTGLGLALSKRLVQLMNGKIGLESAADCGSTFWIELPETENPLRTIESAPEVVDAMPAATRATVLYIEDNPSNLRLVERIIARRPEIKLLSSQNGHGGIALALKESPNLILLDLHLPDIHGEEVLTKLRSDAATADIPVIVVSADATPNQMKRLTSAGAENYLTKPIEVGRFLKILDEVLAAPRAAEAKLHATRS